MVGLRWQEFAAVLAVRRPNSGTYSSTVISRILLSSCQRCKRIPTQETPTATAWFSAEWEDCRSVVVLLMCPDSSAWLPWRSQCWPRGFLCRELYSSRLWNQWWLEYGGGQLFGQCEVAMVDRNHVTSCNRETSSREGGQLSEYHLIVVEWLEYGGGQSALHILITTGLATYCIRYQIYLESVRDINRARVELMTQVSPISPYYGERNKKLSRFERERRQIWCCHLSCDHLALQHNSVLNALSTCLNVTSF